MPRALRALALAPALPLLLIAACAAQGGTPKPEAPPLSANFHLTEVIHRAVPSSVGKEASSGGSAGMSTYDGVPYHHSIYDATFQADPGAAEGLLTDIAHALEGEFKSRGAKLRGGGGGGDYSSFSYEGNGWQGWVDAILAPGEGDTHTLHVVIHEEPAR